MIVPGGEGGFALVRFKPPSFSFSLPPAIYIHSYHLLIVLAVIQFGRIHERGIGTIVGFRESGFCGRLSAR